MRHEDQGHSFHSWVSHRMATWLFCGSRWALNDEGSALGTR